MTSNGNIVKLNIRGTLFQTTKSTLTKSNGFFKKILETDVPITKDESGAIFIDRSAKHFDLILNYMKDGHVQLPETIREVKELHVEAQCYLLTGLLELCSAELKKNSNEERLKRLQSLSSTDIVKLNVGGTMFQTTKSTWEKLGSLTNVKFDDSGNIFINRSPKHFDFILSSIISGSKEIPHCAKTAKEIEYEADFYGLSDIAYKCYCRSKYSNGCCGN